MRIVTFALIAVALIAAGGVALLVGQQLKPTRQSGESDQAEATAKPKLVLVAANDLPAGRKLSPPDLNWLSWPEEALRKEYVSAETEDKNLEREFLGAIVRRGVAAGVPLTRKSVFKRDQPGFLAGALRPGMRAVSVEVTAASGAAGFILPGDRVDVVLTHDIRKDYSRRGADTPVISGRVIRYTAETILQEIRVVAVDQKVDDFDGEAAVVKTVTLEVSPKQAEVLIVAKAMGKLSLTLRSLDASTSARGGQSQTTDLEISQTLSNTFGTAKLVSKSPPREPLPEDKDAPPDAGPPGTSASQRAGDLSAALAPGTRAVSVEVTAVSGAAGFIRPGDHVDIILTHDIRKNARRDSKDKSLIADRVIRFTAETILRDIPVIAVDQKTADEKGGPAVAKTVTLQVVPRQAEVLAVAAEMGKISLSLRSPGRDAPGDSGPAFTGDLQVSPALSAAFERAARDRAEESETRKEAGAVHRPRPVRAKSRVKVYRGGQATIQELSAR